jgi:hypothetical protein
MATDYMRLRKSPNSDFNYEIFDQTMLCLRFCSRSPAKYDVNPGPLLRALFSDKLYVSAAKRTGFLQFFTDLERVCDYTGANLREAEK